MKSDAANDAQAISASSTGVTIRVYVAPRSSANKLMGIHDGALKVALTAPPVEGAANKALIAFLAKALGISKSDVRLASGETSRHKMVQVSGITVEAVMSHLHTEMNT